jgi:ankyrin repeat protein
LLVRYGAERTAAHTSADDEFAAACFQLDRERARAFSLEHPDRLRDSAIPFAAAEQDRVDVIALLLDLGMSPDVSDSRNTRLLHIAAYNGAIGVTRLLVSRGAKIDPVDDVHGTTPIFWAHFGQRDQVVDLLTPYTCDVWTLVPRAKIDRLRVVLTENPARAQAHYSGGTPLFYLPDDEEAAVEIVGLFLAHGADPQFRRADGATAGEIARARGMFRAAGGLSPSTA